MSSKNGFCIRILPTYPVNGFVVDFDRYFIVKGRVRNLGTSAITIPTKAPKGKRWINFDFSSLFAIFPFPEGS